MKEEFDVVNSIKKAVILLSGGMDSTVAAAVAADEGYDLTCLSFNYGQCHSIELEAAKDVASRLGITKENHYIVSLDFMKTFGGSSLVDESIPLPKDRKVEEMGKDIPTSFVPGRGFIFLSVAVALAESLNIKTIITGYCAPDAGGYPDSSKRFVQSFKDLLAIGGVRNDNSPWTIYTPLIDMDKATVIRVGISLGVDFSKTVTCYRAVKTGDNVLACGHCDACLLRKDGFVNSGVIDTTLYDTSASTQ